MNHFQYIPIVAATAAFTSCASIGLGPHTDSALPVEIRHSGNGQIVTFRAVERGDRIYISGTAKKHGPHTSSHIDIQLVDRAGTVLAEKQDDFAPSRPRPGGGASDHDSYVASFPVAEARQAAKVRVTYHSGNHS